MVEVEAEGEECFPSLSCILRRIRENKMTEQKKLKIYPN